MSPFEAKQRLKWFIEGYGIHGLDGKLMSSLSTERICEIYNIDINYFKKEQSDDI